MIDFSFFAIRSAYRRRLASKNTPQYPLLSYPFDHSLLLHFQATCEPMYAGIHYWTHFLPVQSGTLKEHKMNIHDIGVVWHRCDVNGCTYKA